MEFTFDPQVWMPALSDPQTWISLITLTLLEIVLGIDNIVFISILAGKLPPAQQPRARTIGLMLALITRILLLCTIYWLTKLTAELFNLLGNSISWKDLVLILGGLFLIWKSVHEIHGNLEGEEHEKGSSARAVMSAIILQIIVVDIVFSLDSVITAVGLAQQIGVMIAAVTLAMLVMLIAAGPISNFVNKHPTVKMLALSFLLLVGVMLVAEGFGQHVSKGYIYFAMAFSVAVEMLNLKMQKNRRKPVELHSRY